MKHFIWRTAGRRLAIAHGSQRAQHSCLAEHIAQKGGLHEPAIWLGNTRADMKQVGKRALTWNSGRSQAAALGMTMPTLGKLPK